MHQCSILYALFIVFFNNIMTICIVVSVTIVVRVERFVSVANEYEEQCVSTITSTPAEHGVFFSCVVIAEYNCNTNSSL